MSGVKGWLGGGGAVRVNYNIVGDGVKHGRGGWVGGGLYYVVCFAFSAPQDPYKNS